MTTTFTITVANPGSGNKYYVNSNLQAILNLVEGATYKFDQSDSSNSGHPLRLSTTSDGSHNSGSAYTTGVTTAGTPGSSGAYTQIQVAVGAPTLYYYCTNHSGMGGTATTDVAISGWNRGTWNQGAWGESIPFVISGVSSSTAVGTATVEFTTNVTGVSSSTAVGTPTFSLEMVVTPSGVSSSTAAGSINYLYSFSIEGAETAVTAVGITQTWTKIDPSQVAGWGAISTTQAPNWTQIAA